MTVSGAVMAQYKAICGVVGTLMSCLVKSTPFQSNRFVEKRADTKLPGKKNMVTIANVFIDDESR